MIAEN